MSNRHRVREREREREIVCVCVCVYKDTYREVLSDFKCVTEGGVKERVFVCGKKQAGVK